MSTTTSSATLAATSSATSSATSAATSSGTSAATSSACGPNPECYLGPGCRCLCPEKWRQQVCKLGKLEADLEEMLEEGNRLKMRGTFDGVTDRILREDAQWLQRSNAANKRRTTCIFAVLAMNHFLQQI